nr:protein insensitive-like [Paramormyrops kingsleyae]
MDAIQRNSANKGPGTSVAFPEAEQEPNKIPPDFSKIGSQREWVNIGPNTKTTTHQFAHIKWGDPKKATRELCTAVFGRHVLATHSMTGKTSNTFKDKEAKSQLDPRKVSDIIAYMTAKSGLDKNEVKKMIARKCADEDKMSRRNLRV